MKNQIMSDLLYHSLFEEEIKMEEELEDEMEDELEHHGVKDMSWGERNGPPYPLKGIDKKIARAQYRKEKERKKRLKKLQKAAKKARKLKQKEERTQEQIRKKKQQLVKKGDLAEIRKNINLFTHEELEYIVNRDEQKRQLKSNKERDTDEKMELFMKRFSQVADMAVKSQEVLRAVKIGSEIVGQVKANKVKDIEAEEKQWSRYQKEFEARNKIDPEDARGYLEFITGGTTYREGQQKQPKSEKKSLFGKKKDKQQNQNMEEVLRAIDNKNEEKRVIQEILNIGKDFPTDSKGTENLRKYVLSNRNKWSQKSMTAIETVPATDSGKKYVLSDRNKWSSKPVTNISQIVKSREVQSGVEYVKPRYQESDRLRALDAYGGTKLRSRYEIVKDESGKESKYDRFSNLKTGNNSWKPKESKRDRDEINNVKWAAYRLEQVMMNSNKNSYKDDVEKLLESTTFTSLSDDRQKEAIDMAKQSLKTLGFK
jgi:hypothetical protein